MKTAHDKLSQRQTILREEIARRENHLQKLSEQLEQNFGRVVINSVLPVSGGQRHTISKTIDSTNNILSGILGSSSTSGKYDGLFKSAQMIAAGIAWRYIKKMFK
jgi:hypothetical protein